MTEPDNVEILGEFLDLDVVITTPGSCELTGLPEQWQPIAEATDPAVRRSVALSLWNPAFLCRIPQFARALQQDLADVRVAHRPKDSYWVLVYALRDVDQRLRCWIGREPMATDTTRPVYWDLLPEQLRQFLRATHGGFTSDDQDSHGIMPPQTMRLYTQWNGFHDAPVPGWDGSDSRISPTEIMIVTTYSPTQICVSPRVPTHSVIVCQGNVVIGSDICTEIDNAMHDRLTLT